MNKNKKANYCITNNNWSFTNYHWSIYKYTKKKHKDK